ncbi:MAG TPA: HEAT repeat domain-containing protein [Candidatus Acidoferrum sp.]|nr:HEAT repeat domain-containing protein [Candidatus Acidoferrum sp.]
MEQLRSPDPSVRGAAKLELIKSASPDALPILLKQTPLTPGQTQMAMLEVLAVYKDPQKIPKLIAIALAVGGATGNADVEGQLSELGAPAARALMESLEKDCDPSDSGGYTSWVGNALANMQTGAFPVFVAAVRNGNRCQQMAAEEGLQRAYAERGQGLNDPIINLFIKAVESGDPVIHAAAGKWIDSFGSGIEKLEFGGMVEVLIAAYRANAAPSTMEAITAMLAGVSTPRVSRFMRAAVHAPNQEIRRIAGDYLSLHETSPASNSYDPDAEAIRTLRSRDPAERIEAARILSQSDDALKTSPILVNAIHDSDATVRAAVVAALGELNGYSNDPRNERERDVSCVPAIAEALNDSDPLVRAAAARSLGQIRQYDQSIGQALRTALKDGNEAVILQAAIALGEMRDAAAAPPLGDIYRAEYKEPHLKGNILSALVFICDPISQPVFIDALSSAGWHEQEKAASGLLCTLKKQSNPEAVEPLLKLLVARTTYNVIHAVGATRDARACEPLLRTLKSPYPQIRGWVADALGELGDRRAVPALGALLKDADPLIRISAAHALSEMSDYPAPMELLDAVHDEDTTVQIWAASALGNSRDPKAVAALLAAASYNVSAISALGQSKSLLAVAPLIAVLQDRARKTADRASAAEALGNLSDTRAVDPLISVLNENESALLMSATQALGKLHDKRAIDPLKQLIARWEGQPLGQGNGAVTFAYAALQELGAVTPRQVTGSSPAPR